MHIMFFSLLLPAVGFSGVLPYTVVEGQNVPIQLEVLTTDNMATTDGVAFDVAVFINPG